MRFRQHMDFTYGEFLACIGDISIVTGLFGVIMILYIITDKVGG